ncbi:MAG: dihydrofolate reductase [Chloroflexi bacterium]|nr:dihydrofolate reductase family protein [Anaerolineaceae bacterium]NMB90983.1 dihydrofolate reductase [Chloroflexota bacterium]
MSLRNSVFIATSLDGYIAREDGSIGWLDEASATVPEGEDFGYNAFFESVDVLITGRKTFDQVLTFAEWPYADKPVVVQTRRPLEVPERLAQVTPSAEEPRALVQRLEAQGARRAYVDGGVTIQRFLAAGLIDDLIITTIPILLGKGIPLFGPLEQDVHLAHVSTQSYKCGFVQTTWRVVYTT